MPDMETDPQRMAALLLGLKDVVVLDVEEDPSGLRIELERLEVATRCPLCGGPGRVSGRVSEDRQGLPMFGRPTLLSWKLRTLRCETSGCDGRWSEDVPLSAWDDAVE